MALIGIGILYGYNNEMLQSFHFYTIVKLLLVLLGAISPLIISALFLKDHELDDKMGVALMVANSLLIFASIILFFSRITAPYSLLFLLFGWYYAISGILAGGYFGIKHFQSNTGTKKYIKNNRGMTYR